MLVTILTSRPGLAAVALRSFTLSCALVAAVVSSGAGAVGCQNTTPHATAPLLELEPEAVGRGTFGVALDGVSNEKICAALEPFADFCVTGLADALHSGTHSVLSQYILKDPSGPKYQASFRMLGLSQRATVHGAGDFDRPMVNLRWSFELRDETGSRLLRLTETSDRTLMDPRAGDDAVEALMEDVLETLAEGLDSVDWQGSERRSARLRRNRERKASPPQVAAPAAVVPPPEPALAAESDAGGAPTELPASEPNADGTQRDFPSQPVEQPESSHDAGVPQATPDGAPPAPAPR